MTRPIAEASKTWGFTINKSNLKDIWMNQGFTINEVTPFYVNGYMFSTSRIYSNMGYGCMESSQHVLVTSTHATCGKKPTGAWCIIMCDSSHLPGPEVDKWPALYNAASVAMRACVWKVVHAQKVNGGKLMNWRIIRNFGHRVLVFVISFGYPLVI